MFFSEKRDHIQIIAEILYSCKKPQTKTYIRRKINVSHPVLQRCIMQLLLSQWLEVTEEDGGFQKLSTTEKGLNFLNKWMELQKLLEIKYKKSLIPAVQMPSLIHQSA